MEQLIPFDQSRAGNVHNFCLDNTCKGFGIADKYGSATEAWQHTQQHTDRDIPEGCDVPLFYSYTANIDGVTQNYGHINVRLKDGTVWSDGTIYADIDAYLYNHFPQYVGWGESVNDFQIIEGEEVKVTSTDQARQDYLLFGIEVPGDSPALTNALGADELDFIKGMGPQVQNNLKVKDDTIAQLQAELAKKPQPVPAPVPTPEPAVPQPTPSVVTPETPPTPVDTPTVSRQGSGFWTRIIKALIG